MNATERKRLERYRKANDLENINVWVPRRIVARILAYLAKLAKETK